VYELEPAGAGAHARQAPTDPAAAPASLHLLEPGQVLALARAAGCLPPRVAIVGCQPEDYDALAEELTAPVAAAVPRAVRIVLARVRAWCAPPPPAATVRPPTGTPKALREG
jgi:hydrogenase maturation protease